MFILAQDDIFPTLSTFIKVEDIPKKYGGDLDFEYGKMPNLDSEIRQHLSIGSTKDAETFFIASPMRWVDAASGKDDEMIALSVGSLDGRQRKEQIAVLHTLTRGVATDSNDQAVAPSRPVSNDEAAPQNGTAFEGQTPSPSQPVSNGHITPESRPTNPQLAPAMSPHDQSETGNEPVQHKLANGGLTNGGSPESKLPNVIMPPAQNTMELTNMDFYTPPSDPVEVKQLG